MYYKGTWVQKSARIMAVLALIATVFVGFNFIISNYEMNRDIESVAHRAQVAADADDMLMFMVDLKSNMEQHGITEGYSVPIFQTPANDLSLLYESVNRIIERLEQIKDLPKSETAYQVALDDLRGTIRELETPTAGVNFVRFWWQWLIVILLWVWPIIYFFRYVAFDL